MDRFSRPQERLRDRTKEGIMELTFERKSRLAGRGAARLAIFVVFVLAMTLVAPMPSAQAAVGTANWGGCHILIDVHEHYGKPRTVVEEQSGCARIRAMHVYDNNGVKKNWGVWTTNTTVSIRDSGDQCKGRGKMDNNTSGNGVWSQYVIHDSRNC